MKKKKKKESKGNSFINFERKIK